MLSMRWMLPIIGMCHSGTYIVPQYCHFSLCIYFIIRHDVAHDSVQWINVTANNTTKFPAVSSMLIDLLSTLEYWQFCTPSHDIMVCLFTGSKIHYIFNTCTHIISNCVYDLHFNFDYFVQYSLHLLVYLLWVVKVLKLCRSYQLIF